MNQSTDNQEVEVNSGASRGESGLQRDGVGPRRSEVRPRKSEKSEADFGL